MTDFEQLAVDLGVSLGAAAALAGRAWRGLPMTDREAGIVTAWEERTASTPWHPGVARQRGG